MHADSPQTNFCTYLSAILLGGFRGRVCGVQSSGLYEINAFLDIVEFEKVRLRAGYATMWVLHIDEAFQQVNFNLATSPDQHRDSGSIFFHGPMIEVEILF